MAKTVYDIIKKQNGERFARTIRDHHDAIFEIPDIVDIVKYAGRDAEPMLPYLDGLLISTEKHIESTEDPFELLNRAGYHAEYADTLEKQNSIKKYFEPDEELCTFRDSSRYKYYYIINAVRHNVDQIKRDDFTKPKRQDAYGTSVISIQILKSGGFISIKNRYNHSVLSSDSTYDNNPDNIIPGLSASLKKYFKVDFDASKQPLPNNYTLMEGKIIKYNYEIDNTYISDCFWAKDGIIHEINKDHEMILDYFILDAKNQTISHICGQQDSFVEVFNNEIRGKKLSITKTKYDKNNPIYHIMANDVEIAQVCNNTLIKLNLPNATRIGHEFLMYNTKLMSIELPNVISIGNRFLFSNEHVMSINMPNVKRIGESFLFANKALKSINAPKIEHIGHNFLFSVRNLDSIDFPHLTKIYAYFLAGNEKINSINLPNVEVIGTHFFECNDYIGNINIPKVKQVKSSFLGKNRSLKTINLPNLKYVGRYFMNTSHLTSIDLPKALVIESGFLKFNNTITSINIPNAIIIQDDFISYRDCLITEINLPKVEKIGSNFLQENTSLKSICAPYLVNVDDNFLHNNEELESIDLPNAKYIGDRFLNNNAIIQSVHLPNAERIGDYFLKYNLALTSIDLPKATHIGDWFLDKNRVMQSVNMPAAINFGEGILPDCRYIPHLNMPHNRERTEQNIKRSPENVAYAAHLIMLAHTL